MRHLRSFTVPIALAAAIAAAPPAAAQSLHIKDFPKIFGTYAPNGACSRSPRVSADASGIKLVTAAGTAVFQHTDVTVGYVGRDDDAVTVFSQGAGEGLILAFRDATVISLGGEHLGAAERAVDAAANGDGLRRCGARAPVAAAPPAPPPPPAMRAAANPSVAALAKANVMRDPGFKGAYLQALGPLQRESWLIDMDGPGDQKVTVLAGTPLLQVSTCKDRDCGDNAMLVLYRPQPRTLWGLVSVHQRLTLIGNPPPAIAAVLRRLFRTAWPSSADYVR